jgi:hypothetical protein
VRIAAVSTVTPTFPNTVIEMPNFATDSAAGLPVPDRTFKQAIGDAAYEQAGIGPEDVDVAEVYDLSTALELDWYEDLGFCEQGQAESMLRNGDTALGRQGSAQPGVDDDAGEAVEEVLEDLGLRRRLPELGVHVFWGRVVLDEATVERRPQRRVGRELGAHRREADGPTGLWRDPSLEGLPDPRPLDEAMPRPEGESLEPRQGDLDARGGDPEALQGAGETLPGARSAELSVRREHLERRQHPRERGVDVALDLVGRGGAPPGEVGAESVPGDAGIPLAALWATPLAAHGLGSPSVTGVVTERS